MDNKTETKPNQNQTNRHMKEWESPDLKVEIQNFFNTVNMKTTGGKETSLRMGMGDSL